MEMPIAGSEIFFVCHKELCIGQHTALCHFATAS